MVRVLGGLQAYRPTGRSFALIYTVKCCNSEVMGLGYGPVQVYYEHDKTF
jgi:hypothetical protein